MVERTFGTNCPNLACNEPNPIFIIRTDVVSGITTRTCENCGESFIEYPQSGTPSPGIQARERERRSQAGVPNSESLSPQRPHSFGSPPRLGRGGIASKVEEPQPLESKNDTTLESNNDAAFELTQPVNNSQSIPSSPEGRPSTAPSSVPSAPLANRLRMRIPVHRAEHGVPETQEQRRLAIRAMNGWLRGNVQMTPRERAQAAADADFWARERRRIHPPSSSDDEESDDDEEEEEEEEEEREQRIIAERKALHKAEPPSGAAGRGNDTYELKQTIIKAIKSDINRPQPMGKDLMTQTTVKKLSKRRSIPTPEPRELFHPIMIDMDLKDSLKDDDEIIFQKDISPYNGYSIPKSFLRNFLTKHEYLQHTKYQCMGTGEHPLMITENNIVFEHNNRSFFQFVNGSGLGIPLGLFLRQQLLDALNAKEKYFLIHMHEDTNINPIVSADEVQWYAPPVLKNTGNIGFEEEGEQISDWADSIFNIPSNQFIVRDNPNFRGYDETHTQLTTNVSADHCQPSKGSKRHLLTIRPVSMEKLNYIKNELRINRGTKRKREGGGKRKTKKKKKRNKKKKSRRIKRKKKRTKKTRKFRRKKKKKTRKKK